MKNVLLGILAALLFCIMGCAQTTDFLYGPDATPEQILDYVYEDAYALGQMRTGLDDFEYEKVMDRIAVFRTATDQNALLNSYMIKLMEEGKSEYVMILFAARRLVRRVGATYIDEALDVSGVDPVLLNYAVDAYEKGIKDRLGI
jgi:hypothetical protein